MQENECKGKDYWEYRSQRGCEYKGENFYTITPIPYYYQRRKIILAYIKKIIRQTKSTIICDFGCGDGEYINKLYDKQEYYLGVDISENMIECAKNTTKGKSVQFVVSGSGIPQGKTYDLVYSSAVWAHLGDTEMVHLLRNIKKRLKHGGAFILCEQCAPTRYEGDSYIRRSYDEYSSLLGNEGFSLKFCRRIDFPLHRIFFERMIAKKFYEKERVNHNKNIEVKLICNKNKLFRMFSAFFTSLSVYRIFKGLTGWGYIFIYAEKR